MPPLLLLFLLILSFAPAGLLLFLANSITGLATFFCALIYALCTATPIHRAPKHFWMLLLWYCRCGTWVSRSLVHRIIPHRRSIANPDVPNTAKSNITHEPTNYTEDRDTPNTVNPSAIDSGRYRNRPAEMVIDRTWKWPDKCQAITQKGSQCSKTPLTGDEPRFCHVHRTPQLRKYGQVIVPALT